jgi:tetratricopeptide (TPR) repeat protein
MQTMRKRLWLWLHAISLACLMFLALAAAIRAEHRENWIEIKSPHYTIYSNAGEHDGRRVAAQFEEIRALFEQSFPKLKVDFGKPTIVYVLKDENSLKLLMPAYGQNKNSMKVAGQYHVSNDKNFAVVRADVTGTGTNPYHVMYHEWAHGLFRLNYRGLPLWLDEGLAEYWGGSDIDNKEGRVGMADPAQLRVLQQNAFLPISTLVSIDASSPLYNRQDHAGMFYAESWAIVHYFSLAPEVRDQHLLDKYLAALQATDDPIEAANRTFGDLKKLGEKLEAYTRQSSFVYQRIPMNSSVSEKDFTARHLSPAEGLVAQADYLVHTNHFPEAIEVLHDAGRLDPKVPHLHDELGYYHFVKADYDNSLKEFDLAIAEDPNDATAYYHKASIPYRKNGYNRETTPQIIANLQKVISLQPNFAPAHAFLCIAYTQSPDTRAKAFAEAKKAMDLEPGNLAYFIDAGRALVATNDLINAKKVADTAQKLATWPRDRAMAANFQKTVNARMNPSVEDSRVVAAVEPAAGDEGTPERPAAQPSQKEGQITELICGHPPSVMFTLKARDEQFLFHVKDIAKIRVLDAAGDSADAASCGKWKDRRATVEFSVTPDGPAFGEVSSISFK